MMQPSDKELDKLIHDAAEQNEASGAVPNWEGMQAMLDKEIPVKKEPRKRPFILFIIFFLLLGGSFFIFINNYTGDTNNFTTKETIKPSKIIDNKTSTVPPPKSSSSPVISEVLPQKADIKHIAPTNTNGVAQGQGKGFNKNLKARRAGFSKMKISQGNVDKNISLSTPDEVAKKEKKSDDAGGINLQHLNVKVITTSPPETNETTVETESSTTKRLDTTINIATVEIEKKLVQPDEDQANKGKDTKRDTTKNATIKKVKKNNLKKRTFEITFSYAPELTTIKFSNFDKPGSNYGLLIGYNIFKNTTLQTGVILSKKNYTVNGKDYTSNYVPSGSYKLLSVTGYCNMIEVPLNIKYQLSPGKKIKTSIIAGVSSYFMTRESYSYLYTSNYSSYNWNYNNSSQKNYWLSLATLGVIFEKEISKKFNVGATPFIKIPFKGMGTGDIKLLGTGINFSLTYRPLFAR